MIGPPPFQKESKPFRSRKIDVVAFFERLFSFFDFFYFVQGNRDKLCVVWALNETDNDGFEL
jgi:hypothetical protein